MKKLFSIFCALCLLLLVGCSSKTEKLRIAATKIPQAEMLEFVRSDLLRRGVDLEISILEDYEGANKDLAEGIYDANFFQHILFLREQIEEFEYPIESLVETHIEPMQFYSSKMHMLDELQATGVIAVPSDPTNLARALNLLSLNGVIKVKSGIDTRKLSMKDVVKSSNPYYIFEMESSELPTSLETVDVAVIPGNFALEAGLTPMLDTIILEDNIQDYVNVIAIRTADAKQKKMMALKKAMTSSKMRNFILEKYKGTVIPTF